MSEVTLPAPVKATVVSPLGDGNSPGCIEFAGDGRGLFYICPCGCGQEGFLPFRGKADPPRPSWEWDGNRELPTLSPSVHHVGHWHGWLRNGEWVQA